MSQTRRGRTRVTTVAYHDFRFNPFKYETEVCTSYCCPDGVNPLMPRDNPGMNHKRKGYITNRRLRSTKGQESSERTGGGPTSRALISGVRQPSGTGPSSGAMAVAVAGAEAVAAARAFGGRPFFPFLARDFCAGVQGRT